MTPHEPLHQWADKWRKPMLRFAQLHLSPPEEAEDAVQDTLLAAVNTDPAAIQQTDPRRYLFGILKHKIADRLRQRYRANTVSLDGSEEDHLDETLFDERDHWVAELAPPCWRTPEAHLSSDQFFQVVDACITQLPRKSARVFSMKELLDCEPDDICAALGLSKSDYWQCMSRARKQLQLCLTQKWFEGAAR